MWRLPPRSPDMNPIERFWSWLKKKLRAMDLSDAVKKKRPLNKFAYRERIKRVLKSPKAQQVAATQAKTYRRVCRMVIKKKGAATGF